MTNPVGNFRTKLASDVAANPRKKATLLALVVTMTTVVPYFFSTPLSVSLSYVVHFNNRVCVVVLVTSSWLYAELTRGINGPLETQQNDRQVSPLSLLIALCYVALIAWAHVFDAITRVGVGEAMYSINRLQMLVDGKHLYTGFEYAYGPVHLMVPLLLHHWLGVSAYDAYYAWWTTQYLLGIVALWVLLRLLDYPMRYRPVVFWGLVFLLVPSLNAEGIAYTPVRMIGSAFFLVAAHACSKRWNRPWLTATVSLLCIALALSVSAEQGIGVTAGVLAWLWLRTLSASESSSRTIAGAVTVGAGLLYVWAIEAGYFTTARQFASGAYNFPLTPSLQVSLVLLTCVFAIVAGYSALRQRLFDSQAIPLLFGGIALLPAGFGRADMGHMLLAAPILMLGVAYIQSHGELRRPWNLSYLLLFLLPAVWPLVHQQYRHVAATVHAYVRARHGVGDAAEAREVPGACTVTYRTVDLVPSPRHTASQECMDTGYYFGLTNVFTPDALNHKIAELDRNPRAPLLLRDVPLEQQFLATENDPHVMYIHQMALMAPPVRRQAMTYQRLRDYITANYVPDEHATTLYRVWRPRTSKGE